MTEGGKMMQSRSIAFIFIVTVVVFGGSVAEQVGCFLTVHNRDWDLLAALLLPINRCQSLHPPAAEAGVASRLMVMHGCSLLI